MTASAKPDRGNATLPRRLLAWYGRKARVMPWRVSPQARRKGERPDPYRVWLSEIMLQQTTVAAVRPYYEAFVARWPSVAALAAAERDEVLAAWAGLGYYARARNLHRAARVLAEESRFPDTVDELKRLPGVGDYTAAAIAAIAFDRRVAAVDGNVLRVLARLDDVETPLPLAKPALAARATALVPRGRPGDFAQALMDFGATVCVPRRPRCGECPLRSDCRALAAGTAEQRPVKPARAEKPSRTGVAFWLVREDGAVLLRRRPERGLLGGMMEVPTSPWQAASRRDALDFAPAAAKWRPLPGHVRHVFTHFALELEVLAAEAPPGTAVEGIWAQPDALGALALPSLMRKVARHALAHHQGRGAGRALAPRDTSPVGGRPTGVAI